MPVTGFVKFIVSGLPDPVADHGEVHICMVGHGNIILTLPVIQVRFREAPVPAPADKAPSVHENAQDPVFHFIGHFPYPGLECPGIGHGPVGQLKLQFYLVQVWVSVAIGPPELRIADAQSGMVFGGQLHHFCFLSFQAYLLLNGDGPVSPAQFPPYRIRTVIAEGHFQMDIGRGGIGQVQVRIHKGILHGDRTCRTEEYVVPDADVASPDGRDPVPSDGSMIGGIIGSQDPAVPVGADQKIFPPSPF